MEPKTKSNSSPVCIKDLPGELLTEIFIRLPSIDLFRSKLVCKPWLSLLNNSSYFVGDFVLQRVRERPNEEVTQLLHGIWNATEMVTVTPTWFCADASMFSLDFLPLFDGLPAQNHDLLEVVLGSSNGLLLCTNIYLERARYCICNPITKQWLELPPYAEYLENDSQDIKVGFISDPFYNINDDHSVVTVNSEFRVKVVVIDYSKYAMTANDDTSYRFVEVGAFSSVTGQWTHSRVALPDHVENELEYRVRDDRPREMLVPYNRRLYWLIDHGRGFLVFDTTAEVFVMNPLNHPPHALLKENGDMARFIGLSFCGGSLWTAQALRWTLRVYRLLEDDEWSVHYDVDLNVEFSGGKLGEVEEEHIKFYTMHPTDHGIGYLATNRELMLCNFRTGTLTRLVHRNQFDQFYMLPVYLPLWPTPLPQLPNV